MILSAFLFFYVVLSYDIDIDASFSIYRGSEYPVCLFDGDEYIVTIDDYFDFTVWKYTSYGSAYSYDEFSVSDLGGDYPIAFLDNYVYYVDDSSTVKRREYDGYSISGSYAQTVCYCLGEPFSFYVSPSGGDVLVLERDSSGDLVFEYIDPSGDTAPDTTFWPNGNATHYFLPNRIVMEVDMSTYYAQVIEDGVYYDQYYLDVPSGYDLVDIYWITDHDYWLYLLERDSGDNYLAYCSDTVCGSTIIANYNYTAIPGIDTLVYYYFDDWYYDLRVGFLDGTGTMFSEVKTSVYSYYNLTGVVWSSSSTRTLTFFFSDDYESYYVVAKITDPSSFLSWVGRFFVFFLIVAAIYGCVALSKSEEEKRKMKKEERKRKKKEKEELELAEKITAPAPVTMSSTPGNQMMMNTGAPMMNSPGQMNPGMPMMNPGAPMMNSPGQMNPGMPMMNTGAPMMNSPGQMNPGMPMMNTGAPMMNSPGRMNPGMPMMDNGSMGMNNSGNQSYYYDPYKD